MPGARNRVRRPRNQIKRANKLKVGPSRVGRQSTGRNQHGFCECRFLMRNRPGANTGNAIPDDAGRWWWCAVRAAESDCRIEKCINHPQCVWCGGWWRLAGIRHSSRVRPLSPPSRLPGRLEADVCDGYLGRPPSACLLACLARKLQRWRRRRVTSCRAAGNGGRETAPEIPDTSPSFAGAWSVGNRITDAWAGRVFV